jgi:hypothetical protein
VVVDLLRVFGVIEFVLKERRIEFGACVAMARGFAPAMA